MSKKERHNRKILEFILNIINVALPLIAIGSCDKQWTPLILIGIWIITLGIDSVNDLKLHPWAGMQL